MDTYDVRGMHPMNAAPLSRGVYPGSAFYQVRPKGEIYEVNIEGADPQLIADVRELAASRDDIIILEKKEGK